MTTDAPDPRAHSPSVHDPGEHDALAHAWLQAARAAPVRDELLDIHDQIARTIAARGPTCWTTGRCCHFGAFGHRLYATGLEAAFAVDANAALHARPDHALHDRAQTSRRSLPIHQPDSLRAHQPALTHALLDEADRRQGCPFHVARLCTAHAIRPLACRTFFCDRTSDAWQHELTEQVHRRILLLHEQHAIPYRYGPWVGMLRTVLGPGPSQLHERPSQKHPSH